MELRRLLADSVTAISTPDRIDIRYSYFTVCLPHALYSEPECSSREVRGIIWIYGFGDLSDIVFMRNGSLRPIPNPTSAFQNHPEAYLQRARALIEGSG